MQRTWRHYVLLAFGIFCSSTAVIMIKASTENPFLIAAYRLLLATLFLLPLYIREQRQYDLPYGKRQLSWSLLPGVLLAAHFITWNTGIQLTPVANASLIVNMTPVAMPFFLWIFYKERVNKQEVFGTLLAISGLVVLAMGSQKLSLQANQGNLICFFSMLCLAAYLALGRRNSGRLPLWLYMVPLYFFAGLICFSGSFFFVNPFKDYTVANILIFLGLAIIPTIGGHGTANYSMKFFRGQVVSVAYLGQIIFSAIMGYIFFQEVPISAFYLTAILIISGILISLFSGYRRFRPATK